MEAVNRLNSAYRRAHEALPHGPASFAIEEVDRWCFDGSMNGRTPEDNDIDHYADMLSDALDMDPPRFRGSLLCVLRRPDA